MEKNELINQRKFKEKSKEKELLTKNKEIKKISNFWVYIIVLISFLAFLINKYLNRNKKHYDYLIVGAGLYGAVFNYFAKKAGKTTLVVEKRNVTGGNLYCEKIEDIFVHKYGPHIFHTNNKTIWDLVNSIVEFYPFNYQPLTKVGNQLYDYTFNMWTFQKLWGITKPKDAKKKIKKQRHRGEIYDLQDQGMSIVGKELYKKFIKGYIQKEWRRDDEFLPPFIIPYLQVNYRYDASYFNDTYKGIPVGCYNALFDKLLNDTEIIFNVDYLKEKDKYKKLADKILYTGKIDEYFNYINTPLDYRTVRWETKVLDTDNFQGTPVIHYPDVNVSYLRVIEHKHFDPYNKEIKKKNKTVVTYEYVEKWDEEKEALYPYNDELNDNVYDKYLELAQKEKKVIFKGRLAEYKYYSMQDVFEDILNEFKEFKIKLN